MLMKVFKTILASILLIASFTNTASALAVAYVINNQCVVDVYTYTTTAVNPDSRGAITPASGYINIYVLKNSNFNSVVQDVSGRLVSSPNKAMYYDYLARTLAPGSYLGSSNQFAGSAYYISMGNASLVYHTQYDATNVTCQSGMPQSAVPVNYSVTVTSVGVLPSQVTLTGAGTYEKGSNINVTASNYPGYAVTSVGGSCNLSSFSKPINTTQVTYSYAISNISSDCAITFTYTKFDVILKPFSVNLYAESNGTVTLNGNTSSFVSASVNNGSNVSISVTPNPGYVFNGWSGDLNGLPGVISSYTVLKDISAIANFVHSTSSASTGGVTYHVPVTSSPPTGGFLAINVGSNLYAGISPQEVAGTSNSSSYSYRATAFDGYVFTGWSGNVSTSTLDYLNAQGQYFSFHALDLGNIVNPNLVMNFKFTGDTSLINGSVNTGQTFTEVIASSSNAVFDSLLTTYSLDVGQTMARSPYTVDSSCVNHVVSFSGRRVKYFGAGLYIPVDVTHNYTLYSLKGSQMSLEKYNSVYTFKSDPSNMVFSYDNVLTPGTYTSSDSVFGGSDNSISFINVVPNTNIPYSCTVGKDDVTLAPYWISGYGLLQGASYKTSLNASLINTAFSTTTIASSSPGRNNSANLTLNLTYSQVNCSYGIDRFFAMDLGCPAWLFNKDMHNQIYPFDKYRYMWVFSSKPLKAFYHQQNTGSSTLYDLQLASVQKSVALGTYRSEKLTKTLYANRIDLSTCIQASSDTFKTYWWSNGSLPLIGSPSPCDSVINPSKLNGFLTDTGGWYGATSSPAYPEHVEYYGIYFTSGSVDFSNYTIDNFKQYIINTVSNADDVLLKVGQIPEDPGIEPFYVATTTTYVATTTTSTTTNIYTATSTLLSSSTLTHICGYYGSNGNSCSYTSLTVFKTANTGRAGFSLITGSSTSIGTSTLVLGASSDGSSCNSGGCNLIDLQLYSSSITNTTAWGSLPSYIVIASGTPVNSGGNKVIFNIPSGTFSPNTTYYLGIKFNNETATRDAYFDNPAISALSANYLIDGYYTSTTTTTIVDGHYVTNPGYWTTTNSATTTAVVTSATIPTNSNGLPVFSNESYGTSFTTSVGYSPILTGLDTNIKSLYSFRSCLDKNEYGAFGYIMCGFMSAGMQLFSLILIPSSDQLNGFQKMLNARITTTDSSVFSTMFSIPLRTYYYADLTWPTEGYTPPALTLGINSVQKITFLLPDYPDVGSSRYKVDKLIFDYIMPWLQVLLIMMTGVAFIKVFKR